MVGVNVLICGVAREDGVKKVEDDSVGLSEFSKFRVRAD